MSSRDRSLIALVVLVIVAVGGYFLVVQPEHKKANQLQSQINTEHVALSQAVAKVQSGQAAEAQYKLYAKQLTAIKAAVPSDEQVPQLINELQTASSRNKVGFEAVSTSASTAAVAAAGTTATSFPSQSFSLSFTGNYFSVANLLGTLASFVRADDKRFKVSGRLISISSVALSPGASVGTATSTASSGEVTASVTALDYDIPTASLSSGTLAGG